MSRTNTFEGWLNDIEIHLEDMWRDLGCTMTDDEYSRLIETFENTLDRLDNG